MYEENKSRQNALLSKEITKLATLVGQGQRRTMHLSRSDGKAIRSHENDHCKLS